MELYFNFKNKIKFMYNFAFCDDSYLLPIRLDLWYLTFMSLGEYTPWKDRLKGKTLPQEWAAPSGGRLDVKQAQAEAWRFPPVCLGSLLVSHLLCSYSCCHALVTASLTFQHGPKTNGLQEAARLPARDWCCWDSQPPALSSFQILSPHSMKKVIVGLPSLYHMSV